MAKILIVDDDKLLLNATSDAIEQAGYETILAHDGKEGLETALSTHPDLIILDYNMPELNGIQLIEKLRQDEWGKDVNVILATNVFDLDVINQALALDVPQYILKADSSLDEIVALVKSQVAQ